MGDLALDTAVEQVGRRALSCPPEPGVGDLGSHGRLRRRLRAPGRGCRQPVRSTGKLLLPLLERGRIRSGRPRGLHLAFRPKRAVPARSCHPGCHAGPRCLWSGPSRSTKGSSTTTPHHPTCPDPTPCVPWSSSRPIVPRPLRSGTTWRCVRLVFVRTGHPRAPWLRSGRAWCRFRPAATFDDPWVDACRSVILIDVQSWPAASQRHAWREPHGFIAPSLDLYVAFQAPTPTEAWLLADGSAPVSGDGMFGWTGGSGRPGVRWWRRAAVRRCTGGCPRHADARRINGDTSWS